MELDDQTYWSAVSPMMSHINVGSGEDCTIAELAQLVADVTGFNGRIEFDHSRPDGTPRKLLDVSLLHSTGWSHAISLPAGLKDTYAWFLDHQADFRGC
jgi:GDP-L-fucose synthase